jgi:hypothetical protein
MVRIEKYVKDNTARKTDIIYTRSPEKEGSDKKARKWQGDCRQSVAARGGGLLRLSGKSATRQTTTIYSVHNEGCTLYVVYCEAENHFSDSLVGRMGRY